MLLINIKFATLSHKRKRSWLNISFWNDIRRRSRPHRDRTMGNLSLYVSLYFHMLVCLRSGNNTRAIGWCRSMITVQWESKSHPSQHPDWLFNVLWWLVIHSCVKTLYSFCPQQASLNCQQTWDKLRFSPTNCFSFNENVSPCSSVLFTALN